MYRFIFICCLVLCCSGCINYPGSRDQTSFASYVGDSAAMYLTEIVVSVPIAEGTNKFMNLHVSFSAIINSEKHTPSVSLSDFNVIEILDRSKTTLSSEIVKEVTMRGEVKVTEIDELRKALENKAQRTFDSIFSEWKSSNLYKVDIVITSIFFTDGSVGFTKQTNTWF